MAYAGFWIRVVAYIIDGVILSVVGWIIALVLGVGAMYDAGGMTEEQAMQMMESAGRTILYMEIISIVIFLAYFAVLESSSKQATLGKMAVGIRVTDANGQRLTFARALGRTAAKIISSIILGIGFLMVAFTEKKQGLHDKMAGTLVMKKG